ncbi:MAG: maleylacetoacetate isomerase [Proteobacteria bacterium]|nr:maleylacetoacetate isomerase [Pseudomonadota bacterium]
MKLYGYYRSSASYRIRIILNTKGIDWDYRTVQLPEGEQSSEEFRAINPMGLVPVLDADEAVLAQSPAIAEYLEEQHPEPALLPPDPLGRARVREMMHTVGCDIHPLQNLSVLKHIKATYSLDDDAVFDWCRKWIGRGFMAFETLARERSADGQFSFGNSLTLADVWLIPQLYNARRFELGLTPYPTITSIDDHCRTLDSVAAAHPSRQPDAPAM